MSPKLLKTLPNETKLRKRGREVPERLEFFSRGTCRVSTLYILPHPRTFPGLPGIGRSCWKPQFLQSLKKVQILPKIRLKSQTQLILISLPFMVRVLLSKTREMRCATALISILIFFNSKIYLNQFLFSKFPFNGMHQDNISVPPNGEKGKHNRC